MRFVLGYALTVAFSAVVASVIVHVAQPEVRASVDALQYISDTVDKINRGLR